MSSALRRSMGSSPVPSAILGKALVIAIHTPVLYPPKFETVP